MANDAEIFLTGNLNFAGGTLAIDVLGTNQGNPGGYDFLFTSGPVSITAPTNAPVNLSINLGTYHPTPGTDQFIFITDGSGNTPTYTSFFVVNGQNTGVPGGPGAFNAGTNHVGNFFYVGTDAFMIDYAGGTGSDIVLISTVPEPGSAVMLLGGVGLLTLIQRRRRRNPFAI